MKLTKMLLAASTAALIGAATPAPVQASWKCWFGKCGGTSSSSSTGGDTGSTSSGDSSGGSSGGDPIRVPEPEQMGLFAMGVALMGYRLLRARRKDK